MSEQNEDGVVQLVDAGVPADHGLSSLGLLMQLAGSVLAAYVGIVTFTMLFAMRGGGETMWMFLLLGTCVARSLLHRSAGVQLLYGSGGLTADGKTDRMAGIKRYIVFGAAHAVIVGALLASKFHLPSKLALGITLALALWPATLFVLFQLPRFRRYKDDLPLTEDKGFEGASILMTVLGLCGLLTAGTFLVFLLDLPGRALQGAGVLLMLSLAMLCVRSFLHVQAGISGLRETNIDRSVELANRYANFGVISSFCAGGALLMFMMSLAMNLLGLVMIAGLCWMLMAWPLIIRRFFSDRQFADLLAGDDAPIHRRAPDAGLTGLGWLLFAHAIFSGAFVIIALMMKDGSEGRMLSAMTSLGGTFGVRSIWFPVGIVILEAWAGFELIRMSPHARIVASVFGVVGSLVTLYINWPLLQAMKHMGRIMRDSQVMQIAPIAIALIIPVATLILVNRKITPTARARFKSKPTTTPPAT